MTNGQRPPSPCLTGVLVGSLVPATPRKAGKPKGQVIPAALRRGDPDALVAAVAHYASTRREQREPGDWLTLTSAEVLQGIGFAAHQRPFERRSLPDRLTGVTLLAMGFAPGTRGKFPVFRLPPELPSVLPCGSEPSAAPARRRPAAQEQQRQAEAESQAEFQAECLRYLQGVHGRQVKEISPLELLRQLGTSVEQQTNVMTRRAAAALRHAGWVRFRSSLGDRPWLFRRPEAWAGRVARDIEYIESSPAPTDGAPVRLAPADVCRLDLRSRTPALIDAQHTPERWQAASVRSCVT